MIDSMSLLVNIHSIYFNTLFNRNMAQAGMLGIFPDVVFECVGIFYTQWGLYHPWVQIPTKANPRLMTSIETSSLFHDLGCRNILFICVDYFDLI